MTHAAADRPRSAWQQQVEGVWHGYPAVFEPDGRHLGFVTVDRDVRLQDDGSPEIVVHNDTDFTGAVNDRIGTPELVLRAIDTPHGRVYDGRDFHGSGQPFGRLLIGRDFITPWGLDTVVWVQVLPDGRSQLYTNLAYAGPRLFSVLGGRYALDPPDVDEYRAGQRRFATDTFTWPEATWSGSVEVHDGTASHEEPMRVTSRGGRLTVDGGGLDAPARTDVRTDGVEQHYLGPDLFGNAVAYGRMLLGSRHVRGIAHRIETREVLLDDGSLAVAWVHVDAGRPARVVNGVLQRDEE